MRFKGGGTFINKKKNRVKGAPLQSWYVSQYTHVQHNPPPPRINFLIHAIQCNPSCAIGPVAITPSCNPCNPFKTKIKKKQEKSSTRNIRKTQKRLRMNVHTFALRFSSRPRGIDVSRVNQDIRNTYHHTYFPIFARARAR